MSKHCVISESPRAEGNPDRHLLTIIEKRIFLNGRYRRGTEEMDHPASVATADHALPYDRPLRARRRSDWHDTLICHGRLRRLLSVALLTTPMGIFR
jgi:hypothetical protein